MNIISPVAYLLAHKWNGLSGLAFALGLLALTACQAASEPATPTPLRDEPIAGAAMVAVPSAPVRPAPDLLTDPVVWLEQGTLLTLLMKTIDGVWYQVRWPEGAEPAWIMAELVALATPTAISPTPTPTLAATASRETATLTLRPPATVTDTPSPIPLLSPPSRSLTEPTASPTVCAKVVGWPVYIIRPGDTLFSIGQRTGASVLQLMQANCLLSDRIIAGQPLFVPFLPPNTPTATATIILIMTPTLTLTTTPTAPPTLIPVSTPTATPTPLPPATDDDPTIAPTSEATPTLTDRHTPTPTPTVEN
jgi:LysM repeat protein